MRIEKRGELGKWVGGVEERTRGGEEVRRREVGRERLRGGRDSGEGGLRGGRRR